MRQMSASRRFEVARAAEKLAQVLQPSVEAAVAVAEPVEIEPPHLVGVSRCPRIGRQLPEREQGSRRLLTDLVCKREVVVVSKLPHEHRNRRGGLAGEGIG